MSWNPVTFLPLVLLITLWWNLLPFLLEECTLRFQNVLWFLSVLLYRKVTETFSVNMCTPSEWLFGPQFYSIGVKICWFPDLNLENSNALLYFHSESLKSWGDMFLKRAIVFGYNETTKVVGWMYFLKWTICSQLWISSSKWFSFQ